MRPLFHLDFKQLFLKIGNSIIIAVFISAISYFYAKWHFLDYSKDLYYHKGCHNTFMKHVNYSASYSCWHFLCNICLVYTVCVAIDKYAFADLLKVGENPEEYMRNIRDWLAQELGQIPEVLTPRDRCFVHRC